MVLGLNSSIPRANHVIRCLILEFGKIMWVILIILNWILPLLTRLTTFSEIIHWECRTWLDMAHVTHRGYTIGPAHYLQLGPTLPTLVAKRVLDIS